MQNYRPFAGITPAVKALLIANIILFFASMFIDRTGYNTANILGLHLPQSTYWAPWQYVTHMFMHGSISHLFFNMFALFM
ncbi:MAG: rhomboid family intramembrane serine protease, partial [Odoribacter sp.]|nr:rhomboid family intramembrane serine protease [Odoribacter sp.]